MNNNKGNRTVDIFIPFITEIEEEQPQSLLSIDTNERSIDMLLVTRDQVTFKSIDSSTLSTTHYTYSLKRKRLSKSIIHGTKYQPKTKKRLLHKYGERERNKTRDLLHKVTNQVVGLVKRNKCLVVLEDLTDIRRSLSRQKNLRFHQRKKTKKIRRRLNRWNFRQFHTYLEYKTNRTGYLVFYQNPKNTSKTCLNCRQITTCPFHEFICKYCGLRVNRHFQATFNIAHNFLTDQYVASADSAERHRMIMLVRELRKFREAIIRDASQLNITTFIDSYPFLST